MMGLILTGLAAGAADVPAGQQAVLLYIKLSDGGFGANGEAFGYNGFEDELDELVTARRVGALDGHRTGDGFLTLYFYGPSADRLYRAIEPVVKAKGLPAGSYAVKRYTDRRSGRDVRVELADTP